jgi:hypothetical protein
VMLGCCCCCCCCRCLAPRPKLRPRASVQVLTEEQADANAASRGIPTYDSTGAKAFAAGLADDDDPGDADDVGAGHQLTAASSRDLGSRELSWAGRTKAKVTASVEEARRSLMADSADLSLTKSKARRLEASFETSLREEVCEVT